jgi:hypothetical protein
MKKMKRARKAAKKRYTCSSCGAESVKEDICCGERMKRK